MAIRSSLRERERENTYLLPAPQRLETVEESHVLEQVREQPETRRHGENGDAEQDKTEDRHGEEESQ